MFNLFKSKIFKRQFTYFFTIIIFTFTTISGVIFAITESSEEKQQLEMVKSYRMETSQTIHRWFQGREDYIKVQASFFEKMSKEELYSDKAAEIIREQLKWNANFDDILIADDKGNLINSKDKNEKNINVSDRKYFQNAVNGKSYIDGIIINKKDGAPILVIAYPIKIEGNINYVLFGTITLKTLTNIVENLNLDKVGYAYLVNNEGLRITDNQYINNLTSNGEIKDKSRYKVNSTAVDDLLAKGDGTDSYKDHNGEKVYGSYEWLDILDVGLVIEFKDKIVMKPLKDLTNVIIVLGIVVTVTGLLLAFLISRKMVEPIYMLVESAEQITLNNYKEPIKIKTGSELDILVKQFNSMKEAIEQRENQLNKKNEELKAQRAEAIQANVLKSQFLANMSHELRTPLNSIIGFTGRVIKKSGEALPQTQKENLQIVMEEGQHLLALINDLLDYSKIEAGKMEINRENFNLADVACEVHNMMKNLIESKHLDYVQEICDREIPIYSDRMKIKQILINLVSNAVKYSEKGKITLAIERERDEYIIKVKDEGIGIDDEHIESIFDEFRQIDGSYTRKVGGTGLGLSITKKLVVMLGGSISVGSILNEGSTFIVKIPVNARSVEKEHESNKAQIKDLKKYMKRILCIDDDQNVQRLYSEYLNEQDYEVVSLSGEEDIIDEIKRIQPEIIILDIMLKHRDGWEILAELKTSKEAKRIPVIMASVLSERNLAFRMKADDYLVKPVLQDEFIETIKRTITKKGMFDVLIADDDDNYLNLITQFLKDEHISFRLARNGAEAINKIKEKVPDLLILDMMMPEKDGFTVIEDLEEMPECKELPVIAVTAQDLTYLEKMELSKRTEAVIQKSGTHIDQVMKILVQWIGERVNE